MPFDDHASTIRVVVAHGFIAAMPHSIFFLNIGHPRAVNTRRRAQANIVYSSAIHGVSPGGSMATDRQSQCIAPPQSRSGAMPSVFPSQEPPSQGACCKKNTEHGVFLCKMGV
jgi:hypothetical protein